MIYMQYAIYNVHVQVHVYTCMYMYMYYSTGDYLGPYCDDSTVVAHSEVLPIVSPAAATSLGQDLTLSHRLLLRRPKT
jgi:hypothetical protein